jgi:hypothetical protein
MMMMMMMMMMMAFSHMHSCIRVWLCMCVRVCMVVRVHRKKCFGKRECQILARPSFPRSRYWPAVGCTGAQDAKAQRAAVWGHSAHLLWRLLAAPARHQRRQVRRAVAAGAAVAVAPVPAVPPAAMRWSPREPSFVIRDPLKHYILRICFSSMFSCCCDRRCGSFLFRGQVLEPLL